MTIKRRKFSLGIRLKGSTQATTLEGEWRLDPSALKFKAYVDGAERSIVTEDQAQTLTNKTIDTPVINGTVSGTALETDVSNNTSDKVPTAEAVKSYVDTAVAGKDDASEITYTPNDNTDWDGDVDPGNTNDALDQLAAREIALETDSHTHSNKAVLDATTASFLTADETKLDGIEAGAEVNPTDAETKTAYENNADTNAFTDAEQTKLSNIEANADVTDTTNVDAAGATMNTDSTLVGNSYFLDEDDMNSDDATKVPSQQSVKAYVDGKELNDIADVTAASPNSGEVLTYNSISGDWEAKVPEGGLKNYITNGKAEADTTGWTVYKNTVVGDAPDDFGGTPSGNLTFTRNTTDPLSGLADFKLSTTAANLQGEGVYYEFTSDKVDLAKMLTGIIRKDSSDSGIADGDYRYVLVSSSDSFVADFNVIRVNGEDLNGSDNDNIFQAQTDATDTAYRLCIHRAVTDATATDVYLDEIEFGPRAVQKGAAMTNFESYTPSGSWTGDVTYHGKHKRDGDEIEISVNIELTGASVSGGDLIFTNAQLFNGLNVTADTNKLINVTSMQESLGVGGHEDTGSNARGGATLVYREDTGDYALVGATFSNYTSGGTPITWAAGDNIHFKARIPILGWSSNTIMSEDIGNREIYAEVTPTVQNISGNTSPVKVDFDSNLIDTTNSFDVALNRFTAPEKGKYISTAKVTLEGIAAGAQTNIYLYKNGSLESRKYNYFAQAGSGVSLQLVDMLDLEKGDYIEIFMASGDGTYDTSSSTNQSKWMISKLANPQTILETETVAARYTSSDGQNFTGVIEFEELGFDTHGAYNVSNGRYTCPAGGNYQVNSALTSQSVAWGAGAAPTIQIYKNGSLYSQAGTTMEAINVETKVQISDIVNCEKGDYIEIRVSSPSTVNVIATSTYNFLSIARLK